MKTMEDLVYTLAFPKLLLSLGIETFVIPEIVHKKIIKVDVLHGLISQSVIVAMLVVGKI